MIVWLLVIAGVVLLDQGTKHLIMNFLDKDEPFVIIKGVFRFSYVENTGAAMGSFDDQRWIFMTVSIIGIVAMLIYLWKFRPKSKIACTALSMVIGGGIGNMVDRFFYKGTLPSTEGENVVIDFLDFCLFGNEWFVNLFGFNIWPWVFNVADAFVCVGAGILILWCIYSLIIEMRAEKAKKLALKAANEIDAVGQLDEKGGQEEQTEDKQTIDEAENITEKKDEN